MCRIPHLHPHRHMLQFRRTLLPAVAFITHPHKILSVSTGRVLRCISTSRRTVNRPTTAWSLIEVFISPHRWCAWIWTSAEISFLNVYVFFSTFSVQDFALQYIFFKLLCPSENNAIIHYAVVYFVEEILI